MAKRTRLERRTLAYLRSVCRAVRTTLNTRHESKRVFEATLDMYRRMVEQVWLATHDPLNILGTAQEHHHNPVDVRKGADECVFHFIRWAGDVFAKEFAEGVR